MNALVVPVRLRHIEYPTENTPCTTSGGSPAVMSGVDGSPSAAGHLGVAWGWAGSQSSECPRTPVTAWEWRPLLLTMVTALRRGGVKETCFPLGGHAGPTRR